MLCIREAMRNSTATKMKKGQEICRSNFKTEVISYGSFVYFKFELCIKLIGTAFGIPLRAE